MFQLILLLHSFGQEDIPNPPYGQSLSPLWKNFSPSPHPPKCTQLCQTLRPLAGSCGTRKPLPSDVPAMPHTRPKENLIIVVFVVAFEAVFFCLARQVSYVLWPNAWERGDIRQIRFRGRWVRNSPDPTGATDQATLSLFSLVGSLDDAQDSASQRRPTFLSS